MGELENRLAVERAFEAWEGGRDGGPYDLLAPDARWTITFDDLWRRVQPSYSAS